LVNGLKSPMMGVLNSERRGRANRDEGRVLVRVRVAVAISICSPVIGRMVLVRVNLVLEVVVLVDGILLLVPKICVERRSAVSC